MDRNQLHSMFEQVRRGDLQIDDAVQRISLFPFSDLGHTKVDTHRELRCGIEEVVYAAGKSDDQIREIVEDHCSKLGRVLVTRLEAERFPFFKEHFPQLEFSAMGRVGYFRLEPAQLPLRLAIVSAGTSDQSVAEEAFVCAKYFGFEVVAIRDVGVAGLPRLLASAEQIRSADIVIVVAGMEGALVSVVAGLVAAPVIAVPTSVGYGVTFQGLTALFGMLVSCSSGVSVVNIDNGFGAVAVALRFAGQLQTITSRK